MNGVLYGRNALAMPATQPSIATHRQELLIVRQSPIAELLLNADITVRCAHMWNNMAMHGECETRQVSKSKNTIENNQQVKIKTNEYQCNQF